MEAAIAHPPKMEWRSQRSGAEARGLLEDSTQHRWESELYTMKLQFGWMSVIRELRWFWLHMMRRWRLGVIAFAACLMAG